MKNQKALIGVISLTLILLLTSLELADAQGQTGQRLGTIITRISNWALGILIAIAAIFIIYAAFTYLTAGGDPEKVKTANRIILYAAVAIAVGLLSKTFVYIVANLLGANLTPF